MIDSHGEVLLGHYDSHDGLRQYCKRNSFADSFAFSLHNNRILQHTHIQVISRSLIDRYLKSLYHNPSHPAPWTDIDRRNELLDKTNASAIGFKLMYSTLEKHRNLQNWIQDNSDVMILHLVRNNLLKTYISTVRMKKNRIAHTKNNDFKYSPVRISTTEMGSFFELTLSKQRQYQSLFSNSHKYCELSYEYMFKSQEKALTRILDFLQLPEEAISLPPIKKISSTILADEISNIDEVTKFLKKAGYSDYLNEFS